MKKTLTVNLGGIVFHIDEDAYRLLDDYLRNLKLHFSKKESAEEIVADIENRVSELFTEKITGATQVITIACVEEVIARVGKPEDLMGEDSEEGESSSFNSETKASSSNIYNTTRKRLFRNPDNKVLGGVLGGLAAYMGWDVTLLRIILLVLLFFGGFGISLPLIGFPFFGFGSLIPLYIIGWIVIPEAVSATDKLNMRGEAVTMENIGKTVTDGFEKVSTYMHSESSRSNLQKVGDALVSIVGIILKACLIILALVFSPVLFVLAIAFMALVIGAIAAMIGGGSVLYHMLPSIDWSLVSTSPLAIIVACIAGVLVVGIPLASILHALFQLIFSWNPMASGLKITLLVLWLVSLGVFVLCFSQMHWQIPFLNDTAIFFRAPM
ncbi:PspC domain-containing protein [uncultured Bacteroides sp.]|uniref:PspC domain-containing protein n=1 Tax=uncultured Bacteroides sp. TaxID=162156 RepID=UPI002AAA9F2C|nr:PspC domain-containing protein [uncultured Bacteroides sp.]